MGLIVNLVGALVLLVWIPLRQRPGLGTISNVLVIAPVVDLTLAPCRSSIPSPGGCRCFGGAVGAGTILHALTIGPLMQACIKAFERADAPAGKPALEAERG